MLALSTLLTLSPATPSGDREHYATKLISDNNKQTKKTYWERHFQNDTRHFMEPIISHKNKTITTSAEY